MTDEIATYNGTEWQTMAEVVMDDPSAFGLVMCLSVATILLAITCVYLIAQVTSLKADVKHLKQREFEICRFCNHLRDGEKPTFPLAEVCYCDGEHCGG